MNFRVFGYVQHQNPFLLFQQPLDIELTEEDLIEYCNDSRTANWIKDRLSHSFNRRVLIELFNCKSKETLLNRKAEWIVLDTYYTYCSPLLVVSYKGKTVYYQDDTNARMIFEIIQTNPKFSSVTANLVEATPNMSYQVKKITDYLKKHWPATVTPNGTDNHINYNVFLISTEPALFYHKNNTITIKTDPKYYEKLQLNNKATSLFTSNINCYVISPPGPVVSCDDTQIHYSYYTNQLILNIIVNTILNKNDENTKKDIERTLFNNYLDTICSLMNGDIDEPYTVIKTVENAIDKNKSGEYLSLIEKCKSLISNGITVAYMLKARLLLKSNCKTEDALYDLQNAYSGGCFEAGLDLIDYNLSNNTCPQELIRAIMDQLINVEERGVYSRIGQCYEKGLLYYPKDIEKAIYWYRKASSKNVLWAKIHLFDILWDTNNPDNYTEMYNLVYMDSKMGIAESQYRLAKSYRFGRGVPKDLKIAKQILYECSKHIERGYIDLFDILWDEKTPESDQEMIKIILNPQLSKNPWAIARIAKAMTEGRGIDRDLDEAEKLCTSVLTKVSWASSLLEVIHNKKNTAS